MLAETDLRSSTLMPLSKKALNHPNIRLAGAVQRNPNLKTTPAVSVYVLSQLPLRRVGRYSIWNARIATSRVQFTSRPPPRPNVRLF